MGPSPGIDARFGGVDATPDSPDQRDLIFVPSLRSVPLRLDPREDGWWSPNLVRDQGSDPSCTGHAVASVVDMLLSIEHTGLAHGGGRSAFSKHGVPFASAIMLYGNARLHDDWAGEEYAGSSLRGVLKGFQHNGVCSVVTARDQWTEGLNFDRAAWRWHALNEVQEESEETVLGTYRRVRPQLDDIHAAIAECNAIVATAVIHDGWAAPENGVIPTDGRQLTSESGNPSIHAVALIGYDRQGFIVQNSWGRDWGRDGTAIWRYDDWSRHVLDVWALRLGVHAPDAFRHTRGPQGFSALEDAARIETRAPTRVDLLGRFVTVAEGRYRQYGSYHVSRRDIEETAKLINTARTGNGGRRGAYRFRHALVHFMGGTRTLDDSARLAQTLAPRYEERGIYPLFIAWEETLQTAIRDRVAAILTEVRERVGPASVRNPLSARLVERRVAGLPGRVRAELFGGIERFFGDVPDDDREDPELSDGAHLFSTMLEALQRRHDAGSMSYHMVAHDTGARLMAGLLAHRVGRWTKAQPVISSLHLVSPMMTRREFDATIGSYLMGRGEARARRKARRDEPVIERVNLYALDARIASGDVFGDGYPHSWPDLWARVEPMLHGADNRDWELLPALHHHRQPRARILALAHHASDLKSSLEREADVSLTLLGDETQSTLQSFTHFDADAAEMVFTRITDAIAET